MSELVVEAKAQDPLAPRYANIEVSYLLQRLERFRRLGILTTNLEDSLDTAFLRRLDFVVEFRPPDEAQRAAIWRRTLPDALPREAVDLGWLAKLDVTGGNIRTIALNAAYMAASRDDLVRVDDFVRAARLECDKLRRMFHLPPSGGPGVNP